MRHAECTFGILNDVQLPLLCAPEVSYRCTFIKELQQISTDYGNVSLTV